MSRPEKGSKNPVVRGSWTADLKSCDLTVQEGLPKHPQPLLINLILR